MKVFISGPMSGYPNDNKEAFDEMENKLRSFGISAFNPSHIQFDNEWTREEKSKIDFELIHYCAAIFQLPGWENSEGAKLEWRFAHAIDKPCFTSVEELVKFFYQYQNITVKAD